MVNTMIESAKQSKFRLPALLIPVVAFGLNFIGDSLGGNFAVMLCTKLSLDGANTNRLLLASTVFNALMVFVWIKFAEGRKFRTLGLGKTGVGKGSAIGAATGLLSFSAIVGVGYAAHVLKFQGADVGAWNIFSVLLMMPFWFIQAGSEEFLTRGWVLPEVSAKTNRLAGIILSSLLFAAMHIGTAGFSAMAVVNVFLIGVLLALFTLKRDSLWGAIMFHTFWNFTQGTLFGLSVSGGSAQKPSLMNFISEGSALLSGGTFGIEASIFTTIAAVIMIAVLLLADKGRLVKTLMIKGGNAVEEY